MELKIAVKNKIATGDDTIIVCQNTDYVARFEFDDEWNSETVKTARFIWNGKHRDVVFEGDTCKVPAIDNVLFLTVGVYAGDLRTTTPASFKCSSSILNDSVPHDEPDPDVYNQIVGLCNEAVETANKVNTTEYQENIVNQVLEALPKAEEAMITYE